MSLATDTVFAILRVAELLIEGDASSKLIHAATHAVSMAARAAEDDYTEEQCRIITERIDRLSLLLAAPINKR
jgi:hypothetical protein